jgi:hypothetical protein
MKKLLVLVAAIALVCVSLPAMAVEWNFYGDARMFTFYVSDDAADSELRNLGTVGNKEAFLQWEMQGQSRIGAKVKADAVRGMFELSLDNLGNADVDVGTKRIYGEWNFGPGTLKVGKDYTPINQFISGQAFNGDLGMLGIGTTYGARPGQIALAFGGFEIAFISPNTGQLSGLGTNAVRAAAIASAEAALASAVAAGDLAAYVGAQAALQLAEGLPDLGSTNGDVDVVFPKVEAGWGMGFDTWNFRISGGYQYYSIEDVLSVTDGSSNDIGVTSWLLAADAGVNFGPAYVKAAGSYGQNVGNAGWNIPGLATTSGGFGTWDGDDGVDKNMSWMAALVAGLKVSDMLTFEAGAGYRSDDPKDAPDGFDNVQNAWSLYGQAVIAMAPGVWLIPEVGYYDYGDDFTDADAGDSFYAGGKWQIDF